MQLFFSENIENGICVLSPEESRHCISVLRHVKGDVVNLFDKKGSLYTAGITDGNPKKCILEVIEVKQVPKRKGYLHVAIAPTKNIDRFEWFVEKAVETGVEEITPIICEHSERRVLKMERIEKIVVSAMKQSYNLNYPILNEPVKINSLINGGFNGKKCIAYCEEKTVSFENAIKGHNSVLTLIGPEGDFSASEIDAAVSAGFVPVSLGKSRLRTETAGVVSCVIANLNFNG